MTDPTGPQTPDPDQDKLPRSIRKAIARNKPTWSERHGAFLYWFPILVLAVFWFVLGTLRLLTHGDWDYFLLAIVFSGSAATYSFLRYTDFKRGWRDGYLSGQLDIINELAAKRANEEPPIPAAKARLLATGDLAPQPWEPIRIDSPRRETTS